MQLSLELLIDAIEHHSFPAEGVDALPQILVERKGFIELHQRLIDRSASCVDVLEKLHMQTKRGERRALYADVT